MVLIRTKLKKKDRRHIFRSPGPDSNGTFPEYKSRD